VFEPGNRRPAGVLGRPSGSSDGPPSLSDVNSFMDRSIDTLIEKSLPKSMTGKTPWEQATGLILDYSGSAFCSSPSFV
jgi:hypothetical protein